MLHVYAVEPESLSCFNSIWQALESFGFDHGRLVARFPKKWLAMVYEASAGCSALERKRIEVSLRKLKPAVVRTAAEYKEGTWRENAHREHEHFRGVIQNNNTEDYAFVLTGLDLCDDHPNWRTQKDLAVERSPEAMADALDSVLASSTSIHFVDRYYEGDRKRNVIIGKCIDRIRSNGYACSEITIHACNLASREQIENGANWLVRRLPTDLKLRIKVWKPKAGEDGFHARYLLTEKVGLRVDWGFSAGEPGTTTDVALVGEPLRKKRWDDLQDDETTYELLHDIYLA